MASVGHGNYIIPSQCAVIGVAITSYELFPTGTFADSDGDTITYLAPSPWNGIGKQLLTLTGNVKFSLSTRLIYGTPGGDLVGGNNYTTSIIATSSDTSTDSLPITVHIGASGSAYPLYAVSSYQKKITLSVSSDFSVGSAAHTLGTATADAYAIVWADDNQVGDSEGTNRSPFSISNTGVITVTGTLAIKTYKLWVRATYSTNGNFDVAWVEITNAYTTSSIAGYIGGIPIM